MTLPASYAVLKVYDRDGTTLRDEFMATGVSWTDELGGEGTASYTVPLVQKVIKANPTLLNDAIVKIAVPLAAGEAPTDIFAWVSNPGSGTLVSEQLAAGYVEQPASRGLLSLFGEPILLHEGGLRARGAPSRYFGWMSKIGIWYDPADWDPANQLDAWSSNITPERTNQPPGWAYPSANWIRLVPQHRFVLWRKTFTLTETALVRFQFTADESFSAYLDSEELMFSAQVETGYTVNNRSDDILLGAGTHTVGVAVEIINSGVAGDGVDAFMGVITLPDLFGNDGAVISMTDASWLGFTHSVNDPRPGWTAADIILTLIGEASARGITSMTRIVPSFTHLLTTDGAPFEEREERVWTVGTSLLQIMNDVAETTITFDMRPDFTLDAYVRQGTDRTALATCPALVPGANLISYTWQGQPIIATRVLVYTNSGYQMLTNSTVEATHEPREIYLEAGTSVSVKQGETVGVAALRTFSREARTYTAEMVARPGCVPMRDFGKGDTIWGLDNLAQRIPVRVVSIGGNIPDAGGHVRWVLELSEDVGQAMTIEV